MLISDRNLGRDSTIEPAYVAERNMEEGWKQAVAQLQREINSLQGELDEVRTGPIELQFIDDLEPYNDQGGVG